MAPQSQTYSMDEIEEVLDRIISKIEVDRTLGDGCWKWTGSFNSKGYPVITLGKLSGNKVALAHRVVYTHSAGPIPPGLELDHLCFNKICVRPDHLEPVTGAVNMQRAVARRRALKALEALANGEDA